MALAPGGGQSVNSEQIKWAQIVDIKHGLGPYTLPSTKEVLFETPRYSSQHTRCDSSTQAPSDLSMQISLSVFILQAPKYIYSLQSENEVSHLSFRLLCLSILIPLQRFRLAMCKIFAKIL